MDNLLERTKIARALYSPKHVSSDELKNYFQPQKENIGPEVTPSGMVFLPTHAIYPTGKITANQHAPKKPAFNHGVTLKIPDELLLMKMPPPKPKLSYPGEERLDSLIYSTLKEIKPNSSNSFDEPVEEMTHSQPLFQLQPDRPPFLSHVLGEKSHSKVSDDFNSKDVSESRSRESSLGLTIPEDFVNLDRKSILKARFRKAMQFTKNALAFLLSHIGLSCLVVGYTILGALMFCAVEREQEQIVKHDMMKDMNNTLQEIMETWMVSYSTLQDEIKAFHDLIAQANMTTNTPPQSVEGLEWYLHGVELSKGIIPKHWIENMISENATTNIQTALTSASKIDPLNAQTLALTAAQTSYKDMLKMFNQTETGSQRRKYELLDDAIRENVTKILSCYINKTIIAIKDRGWNGAMNTDDINWTFEGGVLFAITVITTIGKYGYILFLSHLEKVEAAVTRKVPGLKRMSYVNQLKAFNFFVLQRRRQWGDTIWTF